MRLSDGSESGPLMISAADLTIDEHMSLSSEQSKYEAAHCTLGMVVRAFVSAGGVEPIRIVFGWDPDVDLSDDSLKVPGVLSKKLVLELPPPLETVQLFKDNGGIDLMAQPEANPSVKD